MKKVYSEKFEEKWDEKYELLKINYSHFGYLNVPRNFCTKNGITYDSDGYKLYVWLCNQKRFYKTNRLSKDRISKLEEVGVIFNYKDEVWNDMFETYKNYKEKNKEIPDELLVDGKSLSNWLMIQRSKYKRNKLTSEQVEKLKSIEFLSTSFNEIWDKKYDLATKYYKLYDNINFKRQEKYESEAMGQWIKFQRNNKADKKLSLNREAKLLQIGIIFSIKANEKMIKDLFDEYCIDYGEYRNLLKNKSYQEIYSRFEYLKSNEIPIIINGKLNPFILLKIEDLEEEYNISIEQLICMYYLKNKEVRKNVDNIIYNYKCEDKWMDMYKLALNYRNFYGNLKIPVDFKTLDGINFNENGYALGSWLILQRKNQRDGKLSTDRYNLLNEIGIEYFSDKKNKR